jgi:ribosomal protein L29
VNYSGNGHHQPEPDALEKRHFELCHELFELRAQLRNRQGLPSGRVGHVRQQARALEAEIELLELALGAAKVETLAAQRAAAGPPKSRRFLERFYVTASQQLPPAILARIEQAAANKGGASL